MPRLILAPLFAEDDVLLRRVTCDGVDAPRPVDEGTDGACIVLVLQGRFTFRDQAGRAVASPAVGLCLPDGHTYCIRHVDTEGDLCVSLRGELCRALVEAGPIVRRVSAESYVRIHGVCTALANGTPIARLAIEEAWCDALSPAGRSSAGVSSADLSLASLSLIPPPPADRSLRDRLPRKTSAAARTIAETIAYELERDVGTRVTLPSLARIAGVSVFHACRVFKSVTGVSMHRYHQEIRLRHALAWLLDSQRPIAHIAADLGFSSQAHLTALFRRRFHITPGRARSHVIPRAARVRRHARR